MGVDEAADGGVDRASAEVWASWFRCLGEASRVLILNRLALARRPMSVGEVVDALDIGQPTVSHHLRVLAETGFVVVEQRGNVRRYQVDARCLAVFPAAAEVVMGQRPRDPLAVAACTCTPPCGDAAATAGPTDAADAGDTDRHGSTQPRRATT